MDPLHILRPADLALLLTTDPGQLPGRILCLNRSPRYHNQLDAIVLTVRVLELRSTAFQNARTKAPKH